MTTADVGIRGHSGQLLGSEVAFRIGIHTVLFRSLDRDVRFFVHDSHEPFLVDPAGRIDCEVEWSIGAVIPADALVVRRSGDRWEMRRLSGGWEEFVFRSLQANLPTLSLRISDDMRTVRVVQTPRRGIEKVAFASEYPWAEFIVCRLLGRDGGLLLHASSIVLDGGALLFVGHTGAGKSTIAEIAESGGARVLSDDRTILTLDGGVRAWGTPWHGTLARTSGDSAPLRGLFLLHQDSVDAVEEVPASRALKELFVRLIQPRITGAEVERTMDALYATLRACPLRLLRFQPTLAAVLLVRHASMREA
jgi:hypothetical protein